MKLFLRVQSDRGQTETDREMDTIRMKLQMMIKNNFAVAFLLVLFSNEKLFLHFLKRKNINNDDLSKSRTQINEKLIKKTTEKWKE